jgi:predicted ATPase
MRVVLGRSHESQQILPFGPWADAFRSGLGAEDVEEANGLRPVWRAALSDLVYGLESADTSGVTRPHFVQVFEAVAGFLHRLASKQPILLVLEDAQWADELSVRLVAFIARASQGCPLVIVMTLRAEDLADAVIVRRALDELEESADLIRMVLSPLSREETVALARAIDDTIAGPRAEQIWLTSEGNPLVAVEVVRALRRGLPLDPSGHRSLPERVRRLIEQRLERLTDDAQHLVAIAATVGREFAFPLLERASDLGEARSARALEELVRHRIVHEIGESFAFSAPLAPPPGRGGDRALATD